jgi:hypothetical protein
MQIVLNHVTRFTGKRICIAGVELAELKHVRPTTPSSDLITRELLSDEGGPVQIGALIDIGDATPDPSAPETEDHLFATSDAELVELIDGDTYLELLKAISDPDVQSAFGPSLHRVRNGYAVDAGTGERSLAVVRAVETPTLAVDSWRKLRLTIPDMEHAPALSVTDLRFVETDHKTIRTDIVEDVNSRLAAGVDAFLMLGLARAVQLQWDTEERHWLQVNGICLIDRPVGPTP